MQIDRSHSDPSFTKKELEQLIRSDRVYVGTKDVNQSFPGALFLILVEGEGELAVWPVDASGRKLSNW